MPSLSPNGYMRLLSRRFVVPSGKESVWDLHHGGAAVAVLALTPERDVVLAREFRPGPMRELLEMPGGWVREGEIPIEVAARELCEETGYVGSVRVVGSTWMSANSTTEKFVAVATDCRRLAEQQLDEDEFVEVQVVPIDEFRSLLRTGQLTDAACGYMALDALGML